MKNKTLIILIALMLFSCSTRVLNHDENKALQDANKVLKILYFNEDYKAAYDQFDPWFQRNYTPDDLKKIVTDMKTGYGKLKDLQADSFSIMERSSIITLYFNGTHENASSYHRVILKGNAKNGYKIYGLNISDEPFPFTKNRKNFSK